MLKKILWAIVVVALIATTPILLERSKVEKANDTYEIVLPYGQIEEMGQWLNIESVLAQLKEAGLSTISIEPVNLSELERREYILNVQRSFIVGTYPEYIENIPTAGGLYYRIVMDHPFIERVLPIFDMEYKLMAEELNIPFRPVEFFSLGDHDFMFIPARTNLRIDPKSIQVERLMREKSLGYDFEQINLLKNYGFSVIPRIPNDFNFVGSIQEHFIYEEFVELSKYGNQVLFLGGEVTGFPYMVYLEEMAQFLKEYGFNIITIEGHDQKGMGHLLSMENLNEDVVRLFSLTVRSKGNENDILYVNQSIRALQERNHRILFVNPLNKRANPIEHRTYNTAFEAKIGLDGTSEYIDTLSKSNRNWMQQGKAEPFEQLTKPTWMNPIVYLAGLVFVLLFFSKFFSNKLLTTLATGGFALVVAAQFVTGHHLLMKAIVLFVALVGPIFAVISVNKVESWGKLILQFLKSAAIAAVSAWFVISMLYGTDYLVYIEGFTGVKVLSALPAIVVAFVMIGRMTTLSELVTNSKKVLGKLVSLLKESIKYGHLIIFAIIGLGLLFYIGRTGNQGMVIPGELFVRQWLEEVLTARPRTTEFLIGFPLFVLGLYLTMMKKKWAPIVLIFGTLGFSSMVGTFTHLHTPIGVSLLRTFNSLTLGFIIGLILIFVYRYIEKKIVPMIKERISL
ncbi:hypothetical protein DS745_05080 [Anaerobacillus alkaliphilus]|uniref:Uncharacterized protein n=1 Tax=Anaerobacillus alkaliphilus TaxID=1548597 RepID=A0A4Q0VVU3_9BACI|nr:DUF5693 family protein [Anaerobacillus alkaliphilus]RXJ02958.1 hypothetical protein DS745_05080 [Anaerobacillus alkaliphilus]